MTSFPHDRYGSDVLATLCERHGQPWPGVTFTVATPSGGTHLYYTAPDGAGLRNTAGGIQRSYGVMGNLLYDFRIPGVPWVVPYIGADLGYA